jgi:hypothetical protein
MENRIMAKFTVYATMMKTYEVEVEADSEASAIESLDDWIADDFEDFETGGEWKLEAI